MKTFLMTLLTAIGLSGAAFAAPVDDGNGREWRQLTDTKGPSWTAVAAICPQDGVTPCQGWIGNVDYTGWVWGTAPQVRALLARYVPAIATADSVDNVGGFLTDFNPTEAGNGGPNTCTYCFPPETALGNGWTASKNDAGQPVNAYGFWWIQFLVGSGSGLRIEPAAEGGLPARGVYLWRETGLGTGNVIANDDVGAVSTSAGGLAIANVLENDKNNGAAATATNVTLSLVATSRPGLTLNAAGAVNADATVGAGTHTLIYRICSVSTPSCDEGRVTVFVPPTVIRAAGDSGSVYSTQGGVAIANVLTNDTIGGAVATSASVVLTALTSSNAGVSLDTSNGAISVAAGTAVGTHSLAYRVCERASPANCADATATVTVRASVIDAVDDSYRLSSKTASTVNVLTNDRLNGAAATTANVTVTVLSAPIAGITFNTTTGTISVAPKTSSGIYALSYRICEIASPANCDQAAVKLELSGKGGN